MSTCLRSPTIPPRQSTSSWNATTGAARRSRRHRTRQTPSNVCGVELRDLPSVDELVRGVDDPLAVDAARSVLARAREEIRTGAEPRDLEARLRDELSAVRAPRLRRVLNATGVIVHTNLGRAPLAAEALERVVEIGGGYSNLE